MRSLRFALLLAVLGITSTPAPALACSCVFPTQIPTQEEVDARHRMFPRTLFEATVSSIWEGIGPLQSPVRLVFLRDHRVWRGRPAGIILDFGGIGTCAATFQVGLRYLIDGHYRFPDAVVTNACTLTRRIDLAAETIKQLKALTQP
jgi:hypothetical protein